MILFREFGTYWIYIGLMVELIITKGILRDLSGSTDMSMEIFNPHIASHAIKGSFESLT